MKKILVFDMDGTLLDTMGMWRGVLDQVKIDGHKISDLEPLEPVEGTLALAYQAYKDELPNLEKGKVCRYLHQYFETQYSNPNLSKPHVKETLERLAKEGYQMYLGTATDYHYANIAMKENDLAKYLNKLYTPDVVGHSKWKVDYFSAIAEDIGIAPDQIVFFDDSDYANVLAKEAGFVTVAVEDPHAQDMANNIDLSTYYIEDFSQITEEMITD